MEAWLAILIGVLPPLTLAALPPRTEKWRRARKRFWRLLPLAVTIGATGIVFINPLGPAIVVFGTLFVFTVVLGFMWHALGTVRTERSGWREQCKGKETAIGLPGRDPPKPWKL
ncbi:MAG: hypothetical protein J0I06_00745 [Planctomycetes bacterium]|nr:hypothetical protein [Planctomycetota bacterium]